VTISGVLHDPTTSASPPPASARNRASSKPRRSTGSEVDSRLRGSQRPEQCELELFSQGFTRDDTHMDGFASALRAPERAEVFKGNQFPAWTCCTAAHPFSALSDETLKFCDAISASGALVRQRSGLSLCSAFRSRFSMQGRGGGRYAATRRCVVMDDTKPPSAQCWTDRMSGRTGWMRNS
jgi:hypothetical protein